LSAATATAATTFAAATSVVSVPVLAVDGLQKTQQKIQQNPT